MESLHLPFISSLYIWHSFILLLDTPTFPYYIPSVSPVKKSGQTSSFNYTIQTKDELKRGVSFCAQKKETMESP